jgi:hypothetical protein
MVNFCGVKEQDLIDWMTAYNADNNILRNACYLWRYDDVNRDKGPLSKTVHLESARKIIACVINSIFTTAQEAKDDNDGTRSYSASVNTIRPSKRDNRQQAVHPTRVGSTGERYMDGYWLCIENLSDGDIIHFEGQGGDGFVTIATYLVRIP